MLRSFKRTFTRIVAAAVCFLFIGSAPGWSAPAPESSEILRLNPSQIKIPDSLGQVDEVFDSSSGKLVIFIQDIHASVKVQRDIASLIEYLVANYSLKSVAYEGNQGLINTDPVFSFPDEKLKLAVAEEFLKKLRLSGAEFARVNSKVPFELWGMEDIALYEKNLKTGEKALRLKQETLNVIREIEKGLIKAFEKTASGQARSFFLISENYREARLDLLDYVKELAKVLNSCGRNFSRLTQIQAILEIEKQNKDAKKVKRRISEIRTGKFFGELEELKRMAEKEIFRTFLEREISEAIGNARILADMASLNATRSQLELYWTGKNRFKETHFRHLIRLSLGRKDSHARDRNMLDDLIAVHEEFYSIARDRDDVITKNLLSKLNEAKISIFVAGGFHRDGVTRVLRKEGISYLIISPKYHGKEKLAEKAYYDSIGNKFISKAEARQETVLNKSPESARDEAVSTAFKMIEGGIISTKAASLGDASSTLDWPAVLGKSYLVPPVSNYVPDQKSEQIFEGYVDDRGRFEFRKFSPEVTGNIRQLIKDIFLQFEEEYPDSMRNMKVEALENVSEPVVLTQTEPGEKRLILDYLLFEYPALLLMALEEVISGSSMKFLGAKAHAKLLSVYAAFHYLAAMVEKPTAELTMYRDLLIRYNRFELISILKSFEDEMRENRRITLNSKNSKHVTLCLGALNHIAGQLPEDDPEITGVRNEDPERLGSVIIAMRDYKNARSDFRKVEFANGGGRMMEETIGKLKEKDGRLEGLVVYLAKIKKYPLLLSVVENPAFPLERITASLFRGVNRPFVLMNLTPQEVADALEQIAKNSPARQEIYSQTLGNLARQHIPELRPAASEIKRLFDLKFPAAGVKSSGSKQESIPPRVAPASVSRGVIFEDSRNGVQAKTAAKPGAEEDDLSSDPDAPKPPPFPTDIDYDYPVSQAEIEASRRGYQERYAQYESQLAAYRQKKAAQKTVSKAGQDSGFRLLDAAGTLSSVNSELNAALERKTAGLIDYFRERKQRGKPVHHAQIYRKTAKHFAALVRHDYIKGIVSIASVLGLHQTLTALYFTLDPEVPNDRLEMSDLSSFLAKLMLSQTALSDDIWRIVAGFSTKGLGSFQPQELIQVQRAVKSLTGRSLGVSPVRENLRDQVLLVEFDPGNLRAASLEEARVFLSAGKNKKIIFLVSDNETKKEIERRRDVRTLRHQFNQRLQFETFNLESPAGLKKLADYIVLRKNAADFALIASLDHLKSPGFEGVIGLASDKILSNQGSGLEDMPVNDENIDKIHSVLFDTASLALAGGADHASFLDKVRRAPDGEAIYLIASGYLSEWLEHLFRENLSVRQYEAAA